MTPSDAATYTVRVSLHTHVRVGIKEFLVKQRRANERKRASVRDAADGTGSSRSVLYEKMRRGEIKYTHVGRRRIVDAQSALKAFGLADE